MKKIGLNVFSALWESLKMALDAMWAHKLRASLTLTGVIIGVTTIISTMTILGGLKHKVDDSIQNGLGTNVFQIQKHDDDSGIHVGWTQRERRKNIEPEYADAIRERCPSVRAVGVEAWQFGMTIERGGLQTNPSQAVAGGSVEFSQNNHMFIARGRAILEQDQLQARRVIVLGDEAARMLFNNMDPLGGRVRIGVTDFEVIGVFESRGTVLGDNKDNQSWIPLSTFFRMFGDRSVNLTVQAWSAQEFETAQQEAIEVMRVERGLKPGQKNDFGMWTPDLVQGEFSKMTSMIGIAAFGICGISLLVAGIGIMNIMLVSVTERTREIGLRKALGGTRASILRQFVIEAVMLSEVGGAIGIFCGYTIAIFVNQALNFPAPVPVWAVFLAIIFCSAIGLGFGIWPAVKASRLDPIEALRYE